MPLKLVISDSSARRFQIFFVPSHLAFPLHFDLAHVRKVSETETSNLPESDSTKHRLMPHNWECLLVCLSCVASFIEVGHDESE